MSYLLHVCKTSGEKLKNKNKNKKKNKKDPLENS